MWTLEMLFSGRRDCLDLYYPVERFIRSLGSVTVEVMKTQVSFGARTKFAWVWLPPPASKKRPAHSIVLTFGLDGQVVDPRVVEAVEPRPGRWTHHVIIEQEADLDDTVKSWLRQAYELGQIDRRKRGGKAREGGE
ncbi:MAG: hypothetical protein IPK19_09490 [Chloroflexi bacterium]|nr:hypothetical protein [Chloroflexota bacterium]